MITIFRAGAFAAALVGGALLLGPRLRNDSPQMSLPLPSAQLDARLAVAPREETIVFAGGCFWGVQAVFEHVRGVNSAVSGYAGGQIASPSYEDVSSGTTGHAESVRVVFDSSQITLGKLLEVFFSVAHDPTQKNRQGPDVGSQYRSAIFYTTDDQHRIVDAYVEQLTRAKAFPRPIVTEVAPLRAFYPAEAYHQHYALLHPTSPYIAMYDLPKVAALKERFGDVYREEVSSK